MQLSNLAKIGVGWTIITVGGIYSFYLVKSGIEKRRYEDMKVRERMRQSNIGEYEPSSRKFYSK